MRCRATQVGSTLATWVVGATKPAAGVEGGWKSPTSSPPEAPRCAVSVEWPSRPEPAGLWAGTDWEVSVSDVMMGGFVKTKLLVERP